MLAEEGCLRLCFHALSDRSQTQTLGQLNGRSNDGCVGFAGGEIGDEGSVDLQRIQLESLEVTERRISGTEIIQSDF